MFLFCFTQVCDDNNINSLETVLSSDMFEKLYKLYYAQAQMLAQVDESSSEQNASVVLPSDEKINESEQESDDSYAADFSKCIRKLVVYSSRGIRPQEAAVRLNGGGLFRVVFLRSIRESGQCYAFLVKLKDYKSVCNDMHDTSHPLRQNNTTLRRDEIYLWWW